MQTVGEVLRNERENKGLSIKEIEAATSIRCLYINAIEEDNYTIVPGEVYLKGFIRNYANYLGLDARQMIELYRQSQTDVPAENETIAVDRPKKVPEKPAISKQPNRLLIMSLLVVFIAGTAWWLFSSPKTAKEPQTDQQAQQTPAIPKQTPTPSSTPPAQTKPVVLTAKYTERCWTSVTADGKQIYEGIPQAGETMTWEAQNTITITAGNAGGIDIVSNGQALGKLGEKGDVVAKTFSAK